MKIDLVEKREEKAKKAMQEVVDTWNDKKEILVIYLEHTELEKAEMYILEAKSHLETEEYTMAIQSIDTANFIIDHIKDKYEFSIKNIF
ncbi:MAG: DUF4363 family protein [Clostridia bacterium]|nr:DUF4363 family protein [Clostridia bacterium]MCI9274518.1 DUF4363 family protein [Clostridia bacterium]